MFDRRMRYLAVSGRYVSDVRACPAESLIGRCHYDVFPTIGESWRSIHRRALAGERLSSDMEPFVQADGGIDWVRWSMVPWRQADGSISGALLFTECLPDPGAERKALDDAYERLQLAAEAGAIGIWDWDIRRNILTWDARMYALHGAAPRPDMQTYDLWVSLLHPEDRHVAEQAIADALSGTAPVTTEFRIVRPDGTTRHICATGLVSRDETGRPRRMVGTNCDITEQKRFEADRLEHAVLERSAAEFRTLAENMPDLCWMAHPDGHIYWYNQRWYDYTGTVPADMEGWGWQSVHDPAILPGVMTRWHSSIASGAAFEMTFPLRGADGVFRPFLTRIVPVHGPDGRVCRWLGTNVDVCEVQEINAELERRTKELARLTNALSAERDKAEQANLAKSRFLAGMSHELRTPLNGILGYAHILRREGGLSAAQTARVDAMLAAGNHLLATINSVLTLSEIEAERVDLHVCEVDLADIAGQCCDMVRAVAEAKQVSLGHCVAPGTARRVITDPKRLRQILLNLLGNAVKFTSKGGISLRVSPSAGGGLRLDVADTGPGIPAELRRRLFRDFQRQDSLAGAEIEGSGLGLALSAKLAALIGGRIGHEDNPGGGSIFWLELPLAVGAVRPHATRAELDETPADRRPQLRILVTDDVPMNCEIARCFLASAGHEVVCVESGAAAIAAASAEDFDVILMDVRMPEMDGLEATRRIRCIAGTRGRVPIIGLTAQAFAEQVADCRQSGMDAHLAKPFTPDDLLYTVSKAASEWRKKS
jgi:PAS domain S-box-containing protein